MATENQLSIANLGTRNIVLNVSTPVTPSGTSAGLTTKVAVTFARAFTSAPKVIGVNTPDEAAETCKAYAEAITTTGFNAVLYNSVTTVAAAYDVDITFQGQQAAS